MRRRTCDPPGHDGRRPLWDNDPTAMAELSSDPGEPTRRPQPGRRNALSMLAPVERHTVQQRVYLELRRSLIEGQFAAGEVMRIQDVASRLGTSTMPVREALGRLVSEQALEPLPNRSIRVPLLTRERLDDLAAARRLIEGEAVRLAVRQLTADDIAKLRRITRGYDELTAGEEDHGHRAIYNHAFHFGIYRAAGSKVLLPIIESLWLQTGPFIRASASLYDGADGLSATHHHWRIIAALEERDGEAAAAVLGEDVERAFELLRDRLAHDEAETPT